MATTPVDRLDTSVAIQFSGHLRLDCRYQPAALHLAACRQRFAHCDAFVHTWSELEPRTPHWRRGWPTAPNASSAECVRQMQASLQPTAVMVEEQPLPPPDDALAPDGKPFVCLECCRRSFNQKVCEQEAANARQLHWGAARHHGWRMNTRAMLAAASLRRAHEARQGEPAFALAVRVRPDDIWRFGTTAKVAELWDCLQLLLAVPPPASPSLGAGGRHRQRERNPHPQPAQAWRHVHDAVSSCAERGMGFDTSDNCLLGRPRWA